MRKVVLYIATSLDGFIAREDGDTTWLHAPEYAIPGEDYGYASFYESIDTILMGNSTYEVIRGFDMPFPYQDKVNYVFTRQNLNDSDQVRYINQSAAGFVSSLKKDVGKDIWLVGGGQINSLLMENDLIDRIILTLIPIVLGSGISLFRPMEKETKFDLKSTQAFDSGLVQLTLDMKDPKSTS